MPKILVTYASKHGATAEIAQYIAAIIKKADIAVDILPARNVKDISDYDGVVLGTAIYAGMWMNDAMQFLKRFEVDLVACNVWVFSSGPTGDDLPMQMLGTVVEPKAVTGLLDKIKPRDKMLFHGKVDMDDLTMGERLIYKVLNAPAGDYREWDVIGQWANKIVQMVKVLN